MSRCKKGFTLVEVLAVIIILAIIALIATPMVLNIVNKAKRGAFLRSVDNVVKAGELFYLDAQIQGIKGDTRFECTENKCISEKMDKFGEAIQLEVKGEMGEGYVLVTSEGDIEIALEKIGLCATKYRFGEEINVVKGTCDGIDLVSDDTAPEIKKVTTYKDASNIKVVVSAYDNESGISYYEYSKDGGLTYSEKVRNNVYTFTGLELGTYNIMVRVYNGTADSTKYDPSTGMSTSNSYEVIIDGTGTIPGGTGGNTGNNPSGNNGNCQIPEVTSVLPEGWATSKTVTANYGSGCTGEYSLDGGVTWSTGNSVGVTGDKTNIIFKTSAGVYTYTVADLKPIVKVGKIQASGTSITISYTLNSSSVTSTTCVYGTSTSYGKSGRITEDNKCILDGLEEGVTYYFKISVKGEGSNSDYTESSAKTVAPTYIAITEENAVYFNPNTGKVCSNYYEESQSKTGVSDGCMKWYIYRNNGDETVDMILDHNTTGTVAFNSDNSGLTLKEVKEALNNNTSKWHSSIKNTARIISADEVAKITGKASSFSSATTTNDGGFYFKGSTYSWLFNYTKGCTANGCKIEPAVTAEEGYWTSTKVNKSSSLVWLVNYESRLTNAAANTTGKYGVRPVITVREAVLNEIPSTITYNMKEVYYNPTTGKMCNDYVVGNSITGIKTGCMKWYAYRYNPDDLTYDLILDHNTTAKTVAGTNMATLKTQLNTDTSNWKVRARLISADEIAQITNNTDVFNSNTATTDNWFYLDNGSHTQEATASSPSYYYWLFDRTNCTNYGCKKADTAVNGYWTSTQVKNETNIWAVSYESKLTSIAPTDTQYGIRPVVTVDENIINNPIPLPTYIDTTIVMNNPVYLDPTNLDRTCTEANSVSTTGTKTGCMKWYKYKDNNDGTVSLLLDHNTTASVEEASLDDQLAIDTTGWVTASHFLADHEFINIVGYSGALEGWTTITFADKFDWLIPNTFLADLSVGVSDESVDGYYISTTLKNSIGEILGRVGSSELDLLVGRGSFQGKTGTSVSTSITNCASGGYKGWACTSSATCMKSGIINLYGPCQGGRSSFSSCSISYTGTSCSSTCWIDDTSVTYSVSSYVSESCRNTVNYQPNVGVRPVLIVNGSFLQ